MQLGLVNTVGKQLLTFAAKNSTTILTSLAVGGVLSTGVLAADGGAKANIILEKERTKRAVEALGNEPTDRFTEPISRMETIKLVWKEFIPAMGMGFITIACVVGGHVVSARRYAALSALYGLAETSINEYRKKVVETLGEEKEREIREEIAKEHPEQAPLSQVLFAGQGEYLCLDTMSGRDFRSDLEQLRRSVNDYNEKLLKNLYLSLNDWYTMIGLPATALGDDIGWTSSELMELDYSAKLVKGVPCIVIEYANRPTQLSKGTKYDAV
jgi:Family of unknown function (DUF6353)